MVKKGKKERANPLINTRKLAFYISYVSSKTTSHSTMELCLFLFGGSTNQMIFLFQFLPLPMMIVLFGFETFGDG
jgi:hypothetical protein